MDSSTVVQQDEIETELLDILRRNLKAEGPGWNAGTTMDEAQIDSFDLVEMVFEIEDRFGVEVQFNANSGPMGAITFGDVVTMIRTAQAAKRPA